MYAFRQEFDSYFGSTIDEVHVGMGPSGELRYPAYQSDKWTYCGVGEFQCYDAYMLADLAAVIFRVNVVMTINSGQMKVETPTGDMVVLATLGLMTLLLAPLGSLLQLALITTLPIMASSSLIGTPAHFFIMPIAFWLLLNQSSRTLVLPSLEKLLEFTGGTVTILTLQS